MKCSEKFSALVPLATLWLRDSHKWPVATMVDGAGKDHSHHCRKFHQAMLS